MFWRKLHHLINAIILLLRARFTLFRTTYNFRDNGRKILVWKIISPHRARLQILGPKCSSEPKCENILLAVSVACWVKDVARPLSPDIKNGTLFPWNCGLSINYKKGWKLLSELQKMKRHHIWNTCLKQVIHASFIILPPSGLPLRKYATAQHGKLQPCWWHSRMKISICPFRHCFFLFSQWI